MLVFCTPHQFTRDICRQLRGNVNLDAVAISLTKVMARSLMMRLQRKLEGSHTGLSQEACRHTVASIYQMLILNLR